MYAITKHDKRQCCCRCLRSTAEYATVDMGDGRRFHFCADHVADANSAPR